MKWIEAKVFFESDDCQLAMEIISNLFTGLCAQGIVVEDPLQDSQEGWADEANQPLDHYAITGYFPDNRHGENKRQLLEKKLSGLKGQYNISTRIIYHTIDDQDWANSWKKYFKPQKIGNRIVVKPTWHHYSAAPDEIVLDIDPGMAFGTGTHPTTAMCVRMLERYLKKNDSFLDVGTGSGILLMAAHRLGSRRLVGIDSDETAAVVARENLLRNHVPSDKYSLIVGNLADAIKGTFRIIAANILSDTIVMLLEKIPPLLCPRGLFIASGIIEDNQKKVIQKMQEQNLDVIATEIQDHWVAIVAKKDDPKSIH